jgi:hypothetical protein
VLHQAAPVLGEVQVMSTPRLHLTGSHGQARDAAPARPDLVGTRKGQFGGSSLEKPKVKDDYEKFVEGMEDILRPAPQK